LHIKIGAYFFIKIIERRSKARSKIIRKTAKSRSDDFSHSREKVLTLSPGKKGEEKEATRSA
jgi:hypothetical protein